MGIGVGRRRGALEGRNGCSGLVPDLDGFKIFVRLLGIWLFRGGPEEGDMPDFRGKMGFQSLLCFNAMAFF